MPDIAAALQRAARDPDPQIAAAVRRCLSRMDQALVARASIPVLLSDDRPAKLQVIAGLVAGRAESAIGVLTQVLASDSDDDCRAAAARGLVELGLREAQPALIEACGDRSVAVRMEVARALATVGDSSAVTALMGLLGDEPMVVAEALVSLGALRCRDAFPALTECLCSDSAELRAAAASAVGETGHPQAAEALVPLLEDPEPQVRLAAAKALARAPVPE